MAATPLNAPGSLSSTNGLRDIKPPVDIPNGWLWLWWAVGLAAAALLAWWAWREWNRRQAQATQVPVVPPHVLARRKLLEALHWIHDPKEFCVRVSDTLRWYLEERFSFRAPERTTEEFLREIQATDLLTPAQKERLGDFLTRCDLVKFAKYEPSEPELRDLHEAALRFVEETEPQAVRPEGASLLEAGSANPAVAGEGKAA